MQNWSGRYRVQAIVSYLLVALFLLYEMAVQVSPSVMVKPLMHDLHIDAAVLGLMSSTYFYSYTIMQLPVGMIFDRFSARLVLLLAILLCTAGILFFAVTSSVWLLALGRFLMGVGSAFAFVGVLVVASRWFPARYFALLVGVAQLLAAVGAASGEYPFSFMVNHLGWRDAAWCLAIMGLVLWLAIVFFFRRHPEADQLQSVREEGAVLSRLWGVVRRGDLMMIGLYAFGSWAPIAVFTSMWGVPYLEVRFGMTNTQAALIELVTWGFLAIASPVLGWLAGYCRRRLMVLVCALIGLVSALGILYWPGLTVPLAVLCAAGIGVGAAGQILTFDLARSRVVAKDLGVAMAFNNMAVVASGALLLPLAGWLLRRHGSGVVHDGVPVYLLGDYQFALALVPLCFLLCVVVSLFFLADE